MKSGDLGRCISTIVKLQNAIETMEIADSLGPSMQEALTRLYPGGINQARAKMDAEEKKLIILLREAGV
jgi:hypothetical protein